MNSQAPVVRLTYSYGEPRTVYIEIHDLAGGRVVIGIEKLRQLIDTLYDVKADHEEAS